MTQMNVKSHKRKRTGKPFASTSHFNDKYNYNPILKYDWIDDRIDTPFNINHPDIPVIHMTRAEFERRNVLNNRYIHVFSLMRYYFKDSLTVRKQSKIYMAVRSILNELIDKNSCKISKPLTYQGLTLEVA